MFAFQSESVLALRGMIALLTRGAATGLNNLGFQPVGGLHGFPPTLEKVSPVALFVNFYILFIKYYCLSKFNREQGTSNPEL